MPGRILIALGWDTTILVDATRRGGEPGTVHVIEPEPGAPAGEDGARLRIGER